MIKTWLTRKPKKRITCKSRHATNALKRDKRSILKTKMARRSNRIQTLPSANEKGNGEAIAFNKAVLSPSKNVKDEVKALEKAVLASSRNIKGNSEAIEEAVLASSGDVKGDAIAFGKAVLPSSGYVKGNVIAFEKAEHSSSGDLKGDGKAIEKAMLAPSGDTKGDSEAIGKAVLASSGDTKDDGELIEKAVLASSGDTLVTVKAIEKTVLSGIVKDNSCEALEMTELSSNIPSCSTNDNDRKGTEAILNVANLKKENLNGGENTRKESNRSRHVSEEGKEDTIAFEDISISLERSTETHHWENNIPSVGKIYKKFLGFCSERPEDIGLFPVVFLCISIVVLIYHFSSETMFVFAIQIRLTHNIVSMTPFYWTMTYEAPYKFCYRRVENFWRTLVQSCHLCKNLQ